MGRKNIDCESCAKAKHNLCESPNNLLCEDHVDDRASCRYCKYVESCITLGKNVGNLVFCLSYKKGKTKYDRKLFDDYEDYIKLKQNNIVNKEKEITKKKKKKKVSKKDKGFISILDTTTSTPIKSPLIKKAKRKVTKGVELHNSENPELWSPLSLIEEVISSDYDPQAFSLVNEKDLPKSHNIISFITEPRFLNQPLYPRQYQILLDFFAAYCPHCSDTKFIRKGIKVNEDIMNIKDKTLLYRDGICPKCGSNRYQDIKDKYHTVYTTMALAVGQRAGKTSTAWFTSPAIIHEFLQMPNPVKFMKQLSVTEFHSTFVGITYEEAYRTIWSPMQRVFTTSNWFQTYHQLLDSEGQRLGIELYKTADSFVVYKHKGIMAYASGPDYRKLRGKCIVGSSLIPLDCGIYSVKEMYKNNKINDKVGVFAKQNKVVAIVKQKEKKECVRLITKRNYSLTASVDHRIPVLLKDKLVNKEAKTLKNKFITIQLGTNFKGDNKLVHNVSVKTEPKYVNLFKVLATGKRFTYKELLAAAGIKQARGLISQLKNKNVLNVERRRDSGGHEAEAIYQINDKFRIEDWDKLTKGPINNNKAKIVIPTEITPQLSKLIGYLIADGWINGKNTMSFYTTSTAKAKDFVKTFVKVFNIKPKIGDGKRKYKTYKKGEVRRGYSIGFNNKAILDFFEYIGLRYKIANTKDIPKCMFKASRNNIISMVNAMMSCDGGRRDRNDHKGFYYASDSKKLIKQLQHLMTRLGYPCRAMSKHAKNHNLTTRYSVTFDLYTSYLFQNEYKGLPKYDFKEDVIIKKPTSKKSYEIYRIPSTPYYTRSEINSMFCIEVPKQYQKYVDANIIFDEVVNVKSVGKKTVYDLEMTGNHLFPANNILVHNTRIVGGMDEAAYLTGQGVLMNATQVYDALDNSFSTIRAASEQLIKTYPWVPSAYGLYLSSTRTRLDFIVSLVKKSKSIEHIFGKKMATWEFNPNITRDSAFIRGKYAEDPQAAERDFASNPPYASDPFIRSPAAIIPLFSKKKNVLSISKYKLANDSLSTKTRYPIIATKNVHGLPSILAIDAGYNKNSYAMVLMHVIQKPPTGDEENDEFAIGVSGLLEIQPKNGVPLNFPRIYKHVITKILDTFNVVLVAVDRWQSIDLRQRVYEDFRIDGIQRSLKYVDFEQHRNRVFNESIILPQLDGELDELLKLEQDLSMLTTEKPISHLMLQYVTSMDTGRAVIKGEGEDMTDDLLRAVVLGSTLIDDPEYTNMFLTESNLKRTNYTIGAVAGFSSMGGNFSSVPGVGIKVGYY